MSTLRANTLKPITSGNSLVLQGDSGGSGVSGPSIDSNGDVDFSQNTNAKVKLPSGGGIYESDGSTEILTESSGAVTLKNTAIDSTVTMSANQSAVKTALNASGSAPIYACRAWVNFRGVTQSGTATASGLVSGQYTATVTSATQFTVVYSSTTYTINTSGNHDIAGGVVGESEGVDLTVSGTTVTIDTQIRGSGNVSSITDIGAGNYRVNITTELPDTNYAPMASGYDDGSTPSITKTTSAVSSSQAILVCSNVSNTLVDVNRVTFCIFR